jgi:hypothetical protein
VQRSNFIGIERHGDSERRRRGSVGLDEHERRGYAERQRGNWEHDRTFADDRQRDDDEHRRCGSQRQRGQRHRRHLG